MNHRDVWRAPAFAKLNLGLEILGRRDDGYHEVRTIMQTVSLADTVTVSFEPPESVGPAPSAPESVPSGSVTLASVRFEDPDLEVGDEILCGNDNLAVRAVDAVLAAPDSATGRAASVSLVKRIPPASGMGGASSNAATALRVAALGGGWAAAEARLDTVALSLGSDVPFFLAGGTALVGGRGERIRPLPTISDVAFVVVFPRLRQTVQGKTAALYRALHRSDYGDGSLIDRQVTRITSGRGIDPTLLANGFDQAAARVWPELTDFRARITRVAGMPPYLTGAGPSHYFVDADHERAARLADTIRESLGTRAVVWVVTPVDGPGVPCRAV